MTRDNMNVTMNRKFGVTSKGRERGRKGILIPIPEKSSEGEDTSFASE